MDKWTGQYEVKETVIKIKSEPIKTNSSYGKWYVLADASFDNGLHQWDYPSKHYYFWTKARANGFIEEVNHAVNNGRLIKV